MDINYVASPTFARVHMDENPYIFIRGPVGSGKSSGAVMHLFLAAINQAPDSSGVRKTRWGVIRSTYPKLKTTTVKTWKEWFREEIRIVYGAPITGTINMVLPDYTKLDMEIFFLALDKEDDVDKLQSLELTGAHINEAREVGKGVLDMLRTRIPRYPSMRDGGPTKSFVILDYNSIPINHWLYTIAEETRPPGHSFYVQPPAMLKTDTGYILNPRAENLKHLAKNYYENMVLGADPDFINVYILNNYGNIRYGRPVYPDYDDHTHASTSALIPMNGIPITIGMDCGLCPAATFVQMSPTGQLTVLREIVTENTSIQAFAEDYLWPTIKNFYSKFNFEIVIDPAAKVRSQNDKKSAMDILQQAGLPVRCARSNDDLLRREAVVFFLRKRGGLIIDGLNTSILRKGFISEYKFDRMNSSTMDEKYKDKVDKRNIHTHVHDSLQYAALEFYDESIGRKRKGRIYTQQYTSPADRGAGY